jgi:beta-galactosidase
MTDTQIRKCHERLERFLVDLLEPVGRSERRGGYNSGKVDSTNNLHLNTECGINRVSVRSTLSAGTITVTASRSGLKPAQIKLVAKPIKTVGGLATSMPQHLQGPAEK